MIILRSAAQRFVAPPPQKSKRIVAMAEGSAERVAEGLRVAANPRGPLMVARADSNSQLGGIDMHQFINKQKQLGCVALNNINNAMQISIKRWCV